MTVAGDDPLQPATSAADSPLPPSPVPVSGDSSGGACGGGGGFALPVPAVRVTSEYDSDSALFFHKISCRFFDRLAKLKLSFNNDRNGDVAAPQLGFITKYLSVLYDFEDQNALVRGSFDLGSSLQLRATQDVKAKEGEIAFIATVVDPSYKLELATAVPSVGLPRATFKFPAGELTLEERENELKRVLSVSGIVKGQILNGLCTAQFKEDELNLRYAYKDDEMSFIPSICLPSKAVTCAFKRQLSPSDKLSYLYNFESNDWSAVYKRIITKDVKFKAGYDSEARLSWGSLWVGDEEGKAKAAPMKMKVQLMVQVPQDDIASSVLMFRVKKRWDF